MVAKSRSATVALACSLFTASSQAAIVFQDDFNTDSAVSELNFTALNNWTVGDGTIDFIANGSYGITCAGGSGGCLDMDGSSGNAGRITSKQTFTFGASLLYYFDALLSGNQRDNVDDSARIGLIDASTSAENAGTYTIAAGSPFAVRTVQWFGSAFPGTYRLFIEGIGGDNLGAILDNVELGTWGDTQVPEPTTLAMAGLALLAAAGTVRRSRQGWPGALSAAARHL